MEAKDTTKTQPHRRGLVLEGGALRGLFTAGVMDALMDAGIAFDALVGVSAGAAFGCNYKSGQRGRVLRYNKACAHDWRYCSLKSLLKTGELFGGEFCYHTLPDTIDPFDSKTYEANPLAFYVVCTDMATGKPVYKRLYKDDYESREWIHASASMPLAAKVVSIGERKLLDGGVTDSVPLRFFLSEGYDRNLVVLTQPRSYVKRANPLLPLMRLTLRRYPNFLKAMARRHEMYNAQLQFVREQEQAGTALVIAPERSLPIGHTCHDPELMQQVYDEGFHAATRQMERIRSFLNDI